MKNWAVRHCLSAAFIAATLGHSGANPTGGQVSSGNATITTVPGTVTVNQASNIAIINWQTFSIGSGELTQFVQPCATSAALNRVLGGGISTINGTLSANGQILLINQNGIVVGPSGAVNAYGFVASTRDIADCDFLSGNLHFTGSNANGVQNFGVINALGGDVYLIGKTVDNEGKINANCGTAGLASGDDVVLNLCGQEHVFVSPSSTASSATAQTAVNNNGTIAAASAELKAANGNMFALAINNGGTVRATAVSQKGGRIFLTTDSGMVQNTGVIAAKNGCNGGNIKVTGGSVWNRKTIDASGENGGKVTINTTNVQNDGAISVAGTNGNGGTVGVTFSGNALGSVKGSIDASGKIGGGTIDFLGTSSNSEAYLSLSLNVNSSQCIAGNIDIDAPTFYLTGAKLTANGATGGGHIFLGEGDPSSSPNLAPANIAYVGIGTTLQANATISGNGGQIGLNGVSESQFLGTSSAKGRGTHGTNGSLTVSGPTASVSTGTGGGSTGTTATGSAFEFVDPDPGAGNAFGRPYTGLFNLASNTTLITSPGDSFGGAGAGAAYLFSDTTGALLGTIRGSHAGDGVGATVQLIYGGAFVIETPGWNGNEGAVTFGNGTTGFAAGGGAVSAANSLVGSTAGDEIGSGGLYHLFSNDYLVLSPDFNSGAGAVTWVNPLSGITGAVSSGNSLVGAAAGDHIGGGGIVQLSNGANYLVLSPDFDSGAGAITNASDSNALAATVSASNSLVGANAGDGVGSAGSIFDSGASYYLVTTANYGGGTGAVTWNGDNAPTTGAISDSNSLVGSSSSDHVGSGGITYLYGTQNYVVSSPDWNNDRGAVTFGLNTGGLHGAVSQSNSLIGASAGNLVGDGGVQELSGSQYYAVLSPDFGADAGAFTLASSVSGLTGVVSASNSLVGNAGDDLTTGGIRQLQSGNILVLSPEYANDAGAVTFVDPSVGINGTVGSGNSLVGSSANDRVGSGGIVELSNGSNFLVLSPNWSGGKGAITDGDEFAGVSGTVGSDNSLVGASAGDHVGSANSIVDSYYGYYLVKTPGFGGGAGAVTWSDDVSATTGEISAGNSLIGSSSSDHVGSGGVKILFDGNYAVDSYEWDGDTGAVTWGSFDGGVHGTISASNSLVGAAPGDEVGSGGGVQLNGGGHYLVLSPLWGGGKGAVTNVDGSTGLTGVVGDGNSLVGASTGDGVGSAGDILQSFNGYYLVVTTDFANGTGAVTWNSDTAGATGVVSSANSLVGSTPGDEVGSGGITFLNYGNYLVDSPNWNNSRGAVTLADGSAGLSGYVSSSNSLVGANHNDAVGSGGVQTLADGNFVVFSPLANGAGAVTWGDQTNPGAFNGTISSSNSLVGASAGDDIGGGGILELNDGTHYLVLSPGFASGAGAITAGLESSGVAGVVGSGNSLIGASAGDGVGSAGSVLQTGYGYYLIQTANFGGGEGAVTWNSYANPTVGMVGASNSLVGTHAGDGVGGGGITFLTGGSATGNYVVDSPDWNGGMGAVTLGSAASGASGYISASNSLVGAQSGDHIGGDGITEFTNGNYLVLSRDFNGGAGAVTFVNGTTGLDAVAGSSNSLVGANSSDAIGGGGITFLGNDNYLVLSPDFNGGAGAVTFGTDTAGVAGVVSSKNSLVGAHDSDHIGSGGIIYLSNGNYLVNSPLYNSSAGAITWGSQTAGVTGLVGAANSIVGGGPDSGEEYAGESADGSIYLVSFTTDTSAGGDGRVLAGSVTGPTSTPNVPNPDFFLNPLVIQFEAQNYYYVLAAREFYIADPNTMGVTGVSVDSEGGAINNGHGGNNLALGSSTANASGPRRLVLPGNGIWNIFNGSVHAAPPPQFIMQQLQLNLSPEIMAHLDAILYGKH